MSEKGLKFLLFIDDILKFLKGLSQTLNIASLHLGYFLIKISTLLASRLQIRFVNDMSKGYQLFFFFFHS